MAMPALRLETETITVENSVSKLESDIGHIKSYVSDLKTDVRSLNNKIDEVDKQLLDKIDEVDKRLSGKIDEVDKRLSGKIDSLKEAVDKGFASVALKFAEQKSSFDLRLEELMRSRLYDRIWMLMIAAALLGVMAKGFKWF